MTRDALLGRLEEIGVIPRKGETVREHNVGGSDYARHAIQPWSIWLDYGLNPWDADIVKRVLRTKKENGRTYAETRKEDYEKIIHICQERIRQLSCWTG